MAFGAYGHKTLTATTAAIIAPAVSLNGAGAVLVQNMDTGGPVYVGFDSSVTDSTGLYVPAMASGVPGTLTIPLMPGKTPTLYGYSVGGQTAPADTRWGSVPDHP